MSVTQRIRVFQVIECGGPGGAGSQVAAICSRLDPKRFEVSLVYATRPGCEPQAYRAQATGIANAYFIPEMTREISPGRDLAAFRKLKELFKTEKPEVVHAHSSKAGGLARPAAKFAGVPRIFYSPHGYSFQMQDRRRTSRCGYRLAERVLSKIGTVVACSPSEAEAARSLGAKNVATVCDAFLGQLPPVNGAKPSKGIRIGACGRLTFARHPEAFVKLAQRATDSRNGVGFVWIGDGELRGTVDEMITDMNLRNRLELTGWLDSGGVRQRLAGLDLFVHFSRWEGLPNAVLEAMANGLAVVASDIPGNRDLISSGENGYLVGSEIELLERTLELIDQPDLRKQMGERGRRRVESDYLPDKMIASLERLYLGESSR